MKNYGLLTLYYYNIYMPFLHPLAGARGWRHWSAHQPQLQYSALLHATTSMSIAILTRA